MSDIRTLKSFDDQLITEMKLNGPKISGKKGIFVGRGVIAEMAALKLELTFRQLLDQNLVWELLDGETEDRSVQPINITNTDG